MSDTFKQAMKNTVQLQESQYEYILSFFECQNLDKKEHLFVAGEICKLIVFCEKGCFRKYYVNDKGNDVVVDFAIENYWVGDLNSLVNKVPTSFNFQALEDCILQVTPFTTWEKITAEIPALGKERYAKEIRSHRQTTEQLTLEKYATAEEKYERLLQRFPGIINRVAGIHIASYLGIKPESLSRMRKKFAGRIT